MPQVFVIRSDVDSRSFLYPFVDRLRKKGRVLLLTNNSLCRRIQECAYYETEEYSFDNVTIGTVIGSDQTIDSVMEDNAYFKEQYDYIVLDNLQSFEEGVIKFYIMGFLDLPLFYEELLAIDSADVNTYFLSAGKTSKEMQEKLKQVKMEMEQQQMREHEEDPTEKFKKGISIWSKSKKKKDTPLAKDIIQYNTPNMNDIDKYESTFKMYKYDTKLNKLFDRLIK